MKRDLQRVIRSLRDRERGISPDPTWVRATRATLLMQVKNTMPSADTAAFHRRSIPLIGSLYARLARAVRGPVLAALSIFSVALGGSIASVSAAESAIPGDTLYNVKLVTEQARLALTSTKHDKLVLKAEFTKRRVDELKTITTTPVSNKDERASQAADILKRDLDTLKQQLVDVQTDSSSGDAAAAAKSVDQSAVEAVKVLNDAKKDLPPDVMVKVSDAQAQAADIGIKALEVMVEAGKTNDGENTQKADLDSSLAAHAEAAAVTLAATKALAVNAGASTTSAGLPVAPGSTALQLANDAEKTLSEVQQLVQDNKLNEAVDKIKDATALTLTAQKQVETEVLAVTNAAASSSAALLNASTSGTVPTGSASSTASVTSTAAVAPTSTTPTITTPPKP